LLVVCNKENSGYHLTKGKTYVCVVDVDSLSYKITNDKGYQHFVERNIFTPLEEIREKQINKILE
jgi:hypothetical protein